MALSTKNGNDEIFTPHSLASAIVNHFNPYGKILEPCKGKGHFTIISKIVNGADLRTGRDFLNNEFKDKQFDWIITNPPWSLYRKFLNESMRVSDNIVFLCLINHLFMKARLRDIKENNFGIVEILTVKEPTNKEWPKTGFQLGVVHLKYQYAGDIKFGELKWK